MATVAHLSYCWALVNFPTEHGSLGYRSGMLLLENFGAAAPGTTVAYGCKSGTAACLHRQLGNPWMSVGLLKVWTSYCCEILISIRTLDENQWIVFCRWSARISKITVKKVCIAKLWAVLSLLSIGLLSAFTWHYRVLLTLYVLWSNGAYRAFVKMWHELWMRVVNQHRKMMWQA